jgi:hypothetical protein
MAGEAVRVALPHEASGAGALAEQLGLTPGPDGGFLAEDGQVARSVDGRLVADSFADAPPEPPLLAALPTDGGCRLHVPIPGKPVRVAAWLPADAAEPVQLRMTGPTPPPAVLSAPPAAPVGGSSHATPFVVASLGVSPRALLSDPTVQAAMAKAGGKAPDLDALDGVVQILPGATLAVFMAGDGPQGVLVLPVRNARGKGIRVKRISRGIARAAEAEGARVTKLGKGGLRIEGRKNTFTVVVQPEQVVVGTHTDATLHAAAGRGDPWVKPTLAALAAEQPLAVVMDTAAMFPGMKAVAIEAGLGADGGAWTVKLGLDGDPEMVKLFAESLRKGIMDAKAQDGQR